MKFYKLPILIFSAYIFIICTILSFLSAMFIIWFINEYKIPENFNLDDFYYVMWLSLVTSFCMTIIFSLLKYTKKVRD